MFYPRHIKNAFFERSRWNGAVIVTGARQVGKTSLIENLMPNIPKVELDDRLTLEMAKTQRRNLWN